MMRRGKKSKKNKEQHKNLKNSWTCFHEKKIFSLPAITICHCLNDESHGRFIWGVFRTYKHTVRNEEIFINNIFSSFCCGWNVLRSFWMNCWPIFLFEGYNLNIKRFMNWIWMHSVPCQFLEELLAGLEEFLCIFSS